MSPWEGLFMEIVWEILQEEVSITEILWWKYQGVLWTQVRTTHNWWIYQPISWVDKVCALHKGWKSKDATIY